LEVVYLIFNKGYTAVRGEDWLRFGLCNEGAHAAFESAAALAGNKRERDLLVERAAAAATRH
jgi:predicted RNA polymerase sigma factor